MIGVAAEGDKVLVLVGCRLRDVWLRPADAERLARSLRDAAALAGLAKPSLCRGEPWGAEVESYDGSVCLRFRPPEPGTPGRVPLPPAVALRLADLVEFKAQQARHKMRFTRAR